MPVRLPPVVAVARAGVAGAEIGVKLAPLMLASLEAIVSPTLFRADTE